MIRFIPFFTLLLTVTLFAGLTVAQDSAASLKEADVNKLIEQYIEENPEKIIEALQSYEVEQRQLEEEAASARLDDHQDYLENGDLPRVGNPEADIKIVEFYDYNCGYCKRAFTDLQILLQDDPNVEVTFVEMPILGESSLEAAKWSIAAAEQEENFFNYHGALMSFSGQKSEANLRTLAEESGLDLVQLTADSKNPEVIDQIEKNITVARDIGIRGTPGFVINGEIYRGYLGYDGLKAVIDEIRMSQNDAAEEPATEGEAAPAEEAPAS